MRPAQQIRNISAEIKIREIFSTKGATLHDLRRQGDEVFVSWSLASDPAPRFSRVQSVEEAQQIRRQGVTP